ncbi:hypothetical protein [Tuberibacillus sp. Marseille-P3662]|uniref:hypothetical protein n=1 Tax=Tuberibacillus sp. Marseille-P3662 TaxID=1965358 RepID=UPI000A1C7B95|nr:hypothetical protein [Tuberibacillus sp. Marseille-P3662]
MGLFCYNAGQFYYGTGHPRDSARLMGQERSKIHDLRDRIFTMRDSFIMVRDTTGTAHALGDTIFVQRDKNQKQLPILGAAVFIISSGL